MSDVDATDQTIFGLQNMSTSPRAMSTRANGENRFAINSNGEPCDFTSGITIAKMSNPIPIFLFLCSLLLLPAGSTIIGVLEGAWPFRLLKESKLHSHFGGSIPHSFITPTATTTKMISKSIIVPSSPLCDGSLFLFRLL